MFAHSTHVAEEHHTAEQKQVGRCAAVLLLAFDLINSVDDVVSHCQPVVEFD